MAGKTQGLVVLREGYHETRSGQKKSKASSVRLAMYKYPRWIEFVASLPKNDRGKIDRRILKARES